MKNVCRCLAAVIALSALLTGRGPAETVLRLPASLKIVEAGAFYGDKSLDRVVLSDGVEEIHSQSFASGSLKGINLPDSLKSIADDAFDGPGHVRVTASAGSYAWQWAVSHGYLTDPADYPESEHPYAASADREWTYTAPVDVAYLRVTFSRETAFEEGCDTLTIADSAGESTYTGRALSGRSVCVTGSSFTLLLHSDDMDVRYGFRITDIAPFGSVPVTGVTVQPSEASLAAGETVGLTAAVVPEAYADRDVVWSSGNPDVAEVSADGVVTAVSVGTALIIATSAADGAIQGSCTVRVGGGYPESDHPYANNEDRTWIYEHPFDTPCLAVRFSDETDLEEDYDTLTVTDAYGERSYTGTALAGRTIYVKGRSFKLRLCSDEVVSAYGFLITAIQAVSAIPVLDVAVSPSRVTLCPGNALALSAAIEPDNAANREVVWSSSNAAIASVSAGGVVTAVGPGDATITATSAADGTRRGTCAVTVADSASFALVVNETHFNGKNTDLPFTRVDAAHMASILRTRHASNGSVWNVINRADRTASEVHDDIRAVLGNAGDDDVSLFYISTHGNTSLSAASDDASALLCSDGSVIKTSELAEWLSEVRGKVIVIIDACGSGGFIYANGDGAAQSAERFNQSVVDAFRAVDPGVVAPVMNGDVRNVGELRRENKFYVLTASAFRQTSWGSGEGSYFTSLVRDGVGIEGSMPADISHAGNMDGLLTLNELYRYVSDIGDKHEFTGGATQQAQVYPEASGFVLFIP